MSGRDGAAPSGLVLGGVAVALSAAACAFAARAWYVTSRSSTPSHASPTDQPQRGGGRGCVRSNDQGNDTGAARGQGQKSRGRDTPVRPPTRDAQTHRQRALRRQSSLPVLPDEGEEAYGDTNSEALNFQAQQRQWNDDKEKNVEPIGMLLEAGENPQQEQEEQQGEREPDHSYQRQQGSQETNQPRNGGGTRNEKASHPSTAGTKAEAVAEAAGQESAVLKRQAAASSSNHEASTFGPTGDASADADSRAERSAEEGRRSSTAQSRQHWSRRGPSAGVLQRLERSTSVTRHQSQVDEQGSPPYRVFLIRHAESMANVDPSVYEETADHKIPLTDRGRDMAKHAGQALRQQFKRLFGSPEEAGRIKLWVSPFLRTRQTAREILEECRGWITSVRESPMLVEQDWGLFEGTGLDKAQETHPEEWQRVQSIADHQGKYWARFPLGESCFDVCMRVQALFPALHRDRTAQGRRRDTSIPTVVVVSHGITIRAFLMMWCQRRPEWFQASRNPPNCSIRLIDHSNPLWDAGYVFGGFDAGGKQLSEEDLNADTALRFLADRQLFSTCYDDLVDDMATWISDE